MGSNGTWTKPVGAPFTYVSCSSGGAHIWGVNGSPQAPLSGKNPGKYIPQGCDGCGSRASAFCNPNRTLYITHWWSKNCTGQVFHSQQMRANGYTCAALTKELIRDYNYSRQSATCSSTKLGKSGFVVSSSCSSTPARSSDSCRTGSQGCISIAFHGKGCSANATESHNLAEGRRVQMKPARPENSRFFLF